MRDAVLEARHSAESSAKATLDRLGVSEEGPPAHLDESERELHEGLRAKLRQHSWNYDQLVAECAYEQWHRLLFARFLAENDLLLHPDYKARVTLAECEELAAELGEPDAWAVAARFAAEILPGLFRLDDPCVRMRLSPEGRLELEQMLEGIATETFKTDDALGWVYQFWQKEQKDAINAAGNKIGGAELGPVTQLFTENYMVRFLLENSLGAWWAARHPESPLLSGYEFLRFDEEGLPAAGTFDEWPQTIAEITVMDPCCGSGHFLVEAFEMLWRMRAEEEGLAPVAAQDAVLEHNLFGLELDPRCVQIAMFAIALSAWRAGGGWRELPTPNIACSGIPAKAPVEEWKALAGGDQRLEAALERLHTLFKDADTLGSLIDPKRTAEGESSGKVQRSLEDVDWEEIYPLLEEAAASESEDPATAVLGASAAGIGKAADLLSRRYALVATNVPYLTAKSQGAEMRSFADIHFSRSSRDLATMCVERCIELSGAAGAISVVSPEGWLFLASYERLRRELLETRSWLMDARLGPGAFESIGGEVVRPSLTIIQASKKGDGRVRLLDATLGRARQMDALRSDLGVVVRQASLLANPRAAVTAADDEAAALLDLHAFCYQGLSTADNNRLLRTFWEVASVRSPWARMLRSPARTAPFTARTHVVLWDSDRGLEGKGGTASRGHAAWGKRGVLLGRMGALPATLYLGELFDDSTGVLLAEDLELTPALWHFASADEFATKVRRLDSSLKVTNATLVKVPFDIDHWRKVAEEAGPLPEPFSDDPTQWLFEGRPEISTDPLQVAVGRLLGYRWPEQPETDDLDELADSDGIVCLPSVAGEPPAPDRLAALLARAYGDEWSEHKVRELITATGSKKKELSEWLRDDFFKQHCKVFHNRPFIWHIWDGRHDGFSALVNYHSLDQRNLERLTYTYLGQDWVERQRAELDDGTPGAEDRLAAALELQEELELILEGEDPYDIYVRWKELHEQPIGWNPDLDDGVRLNIRPFVEAEVLRSSFTINWNKDRGKDPDGSERINDLHLSRAEKEKARQKEGVAG